MAGSDRNDPNATDSASGKPSRRLPSRLTPRLTPRLASRITQPEDPWLRQPIEGRYRLSRLVADGPVTRVYAGHDLLTDESVAVKRIVAPDLNARFLLRFRTGAYHAAQFNHPRIVRTLDYALIDQDAMVVMEWMATPTLAAHLRARVRLPAAVGARVALWLAGALAALHAAGVLHLGLHPRNIFLDRRVGVRIADVGLARVVADTGLTTTGGNLVGALPFLAPEQLSYGALTPATDIYAFGVLMYQALTGELPFPQPSLADYAAAQSRWARLPTARPSALAPGLPAALDETILACLAHEPQRRPADGRTLADRLRATPPVSLADEEAVTTYMTRATREHHALSLKFPLERRRQRSALNTTAPRIRARAK